MLCLAVATALVGVAGVDAYAAEGAADAGWTLASPQTGEFSVQTPCSTAVVERLRGAPAELIPGIKLNSESRVACRQNKQIMVAGLVNLADYPATEPALFEIFVAQVKADKTAEGKPTVGTINGRRAITNRQEVGDVVAQTGFVEVGRSTVVLLAAGTDAGSGMSLADQRATIDKFFGSVRIAAK